MPRVVDQPHEACEASFGRQALNAQGEVSPRAEPGWEGIQRALLLEEGVVFTLSGKVDLKRFGWRG